MLLSQDPIVWLPADLFRELEQEAARVYPLETGGVLLGYRSSDHWVVDGALGPGPRARHRLHGFEPDHQWHAEKLRLRFVASAGGERYLGDWHSHPGGALALSRTDLKALRQIIQSPEARTPEPLSALLAGRPSDWQIGIWRACLAPKPWRRARLELTRATLRLR